MRQLTESEKKSLSVHSLCPYCMNDRFYLGPMGGLSINIYCTDCISGFNVTHQELPWQLIGGPGDVTLHSIKKIIGAAVTMKTINDTLSEAIEDGMREAFERARKK